MRHLAKLLVFLGIDPLVDLEISDATLIDDEVKTTHGVPIKAMLAAPPVFVEGLIPPSKNHGEVMGNIMIDRLSSK